MHLNLDFPPDSLISKVLEAISPSNSVGVDGYDEKNLFNSIDTDMEEKFKSLRNRHVEEIIRSAAQRRGLLESMSREERCFVLKRLSNQMSPLEAGIFQSRWETRIRESSLHGEYERVLSDRGMDEMRVFIEGGRPTIDMIRSIHKALTLGNDEGIVPGLLRNHDVRFRNPRLVQPPPVEDVERLMKAVLEDVASSKDGDFLAAPDVYLMLTWIQPFHNGNKRLARTFANMVLIRNGFMPMRIPLTARTRMAVAFSDFQGGRGTKEPMRNLFAETGEKNEAAAIRQIRSSMNKSRSRNIGGR